MKKIAVDKSEGIAELIDRVLASADPDIMLVIPKGSALAKSPSSFRLLKREAGLAEKTILVESADEAVINLAEVNGLAIVRDPADSAGRVAQAHHAPGVSDIVPKRQGSEDDAAAAVRRAKKEAPVKLTVHSDDEPPSEADIEADDEQEEKSFFGATDRFFKPRSAPAGRGDNDTDGQSESRGISGKVVAWIIGIVVVIAAIFYGVTAVFGRAQVTIDFTQTPWTYQNNFIADKNATAIGSTTNAIPAQVFTTQKNITQLFPATGASANVSTKAQGTITIYNDYSSAPQDLVATTRFLTPDGKIFRLLNDVTVPGAQVAAGGAVTPSSIQAPIIADQGGPAYNVGPVAKLTIPGFQGNAGRYAGFYGVITGMTTGGFTGTKPVPTAADVLNAKTKTTAILQSDLQDGLTASYPNNFKILDGATDVQITKLTVNTSTDANGNFSVFGEASLTAIGFDESAFKTYLLGLAQNGNPTTLAFKSITLNYSNVQASFSKGQVSFVLSAQGTLEPAFSPDQFASSIAGKSIGSARDAIQNLPQLSNGTISVWPVWLWSMPSNSKKINITTN